MSAEALGQSGLAAFNRGDYAAAAEAFDAALRLAPDWPMGHYGLGMALFRLGDYAAAEAPLRRAAMQGLGLPESRHLLCHALALQGKDDAFLAELASLPAPGERAELLFQVFNNRMLLGDRDGIGALFAALPREDGLSMVGAYWTAIDLSDRDGDDERAAALFAEAFAHAQAFRAAGHDSGLIDRFIATGTSIKSDRFVLAAETAPAEADRIEMLCAEGAADPAQGVFFAAADAGYVNAYARGCARSLAALGPGRTFHLHIVDPDRASLAVMAAIRSENPSLACRFSIERAQGRGDAVYYACARFLHLPVILDRYGTAVIVSDIDQLFAAPVARLPRQSDAVDLALFRNATVFPWLKCSAALVQVAPSPGGKRAAALLANVLRRQLRERRNWTLDQAALFSVLRALNRHHPEVRVADMADLLGASMAETFRSQGALAEKRTLRRGAGG